MRWLSRKHNPNSLSPREDVIMDCLCERAMSSKQIALTLHISEETVYVHIKSILRKKNVKNQRQLIVQYWKNYISNMEKRNENKIGMFIVPRSFKL